MASIMASMDSRLSGPAYRAARARASYNVVNSNNDGKFWCVRGAGSIVTSAAYRNVSAQASTYRVADVSLLLDDAPHLLSPNV